MRTLHRQTGFTIVELIVVISVISILAGIAVVSYGAWRERTAINEVKNDLIAAKNAMNSSKNFGTGYPIVNPKPQPLANVIPNGAFREGVNVTTTYRTGNATVFCISSQSKVLTTVSYRITHNTEPTAGVCT